MTVLNEVHTNLTMLKYIFLVVLLILFIGCHGRQPAHHFQDQTTTRYNQLLNRHDHRDNQGLSTGYTKWNELLKRYDHYDSYGVKQGYSKENPLLQRWEHR